jgi:hypothetical protein
MAKRHQALSAGRCDGQGDAQARVCPGLVTKPYQRAGATDANFVKRAGPVPAMSQSPISGQVRRTYDAMAYGTQVILSQSPISGQVRRTLAIFSGGRRVAGSQSPISGQVRRTSSRSAIWTAAICHKALSAGRCDGLETLLRLGVKLDVTKPYQRAGATDLGRTAPTRGASSGHKALSAGRCDGQVIRPPRACLTCCHKALSAGRCDGHKSRPPTQPSQSRHKALSAGRCDGRQTAILKPCPTSGHKALSAGRCDGQARNKRADHPSRVTKPYQRAGATDSLSHWEYHIMASHKALSAGRCDGRPARRPAVAVRAGHKALSAGRCDGQCLLQPLPRLPFRGGKGERGQKSGRKCVHHPSEKSSCDLSMRCSGVNPTKTTAVFSKSNKREAFESSTSRAGLSYRRGARSAGQKYCRRANARTLAPAGG